MKLRNAVWSVLKFELLWKLVTLVVISPLLREIYQTYVSSVGISFNADVLGTFLNLKGALIFLALFFAAGLLAFYELSVVIRLVALARQGEKAAVRRVMKQALWALGAMKGWSVVPSSLYYLLLLPLAQTVYLHSLVPAITIPWFILGEMINTAVGTAGVIAIYAAYYGAHFLLFFVPIFMALRRERFGQAARSSVGCLRRMGWKRLAGRMESVSALTWEELRALPLHDASSYQDTGYIASLEELIRFCQADESGMGLLIELKPEAGQGEALARAILDVVEAHDFGERAIFMSLDYPCLTTIHETHPEWWVGYCAYASAGDLDETIWQYSIDFLAVEESLVSNRLVTQARELGLPVYVWTVYDTDKMKQYLQMGVTGLISDWPDLAAGVVEEYNASHGTDQYLWQGEGCPRGELPAA